MLNKKSRLEKTLEKMMTPKCKSEFEEQVAVVDWANKLSGLFPVLSCLFHIPNGGWRSKSTASRLKRAGVKSGMPDLCLPVAIGKYIGLWLELKTVTGKVSKVQTETHTRLRSFGHRVEVCVGAEKAKKIIIDYLHG